MSPSLDPRLTEVQWCLPDQDVLCGNAILGELLCHLRNPQGILAGVHDGRYLRELLEEPRIHTCLADSPKIAPQITGGITTSTMWPGVMKTIWSKQRDNLAT